MEEDMASLERQLRGQGRRLTASPLAASLVALALGFGVATAHADDAALPKIPNKTPLKVGFAQTESNNPWRLAETKSMKDTAAKCGWQLVMTDANGSNAKQVSDIQNMIAQHVDLLVFPPREEKPLSPVVLQAKKAGIPVILVDRDVDHSVAKPGTDYITFIGSDFINQGQRAADWLVKATNGKAKIIELEGTTGASAANDRKKGFDDVIAKHPDMQIIASQDGDFSRDKGRQVMETLLQAHPDVTAVYAHNDEMALGAIAAIKAAGKQPGRTSRSSRSTAPRAAWTPSPPANWAPACSRARSSARSPATSRRNSQRAKRSRPG
jgi:ABC-type sugar transport system substrate-binding protein